MSTFIQGIVALTIDGVTSFLQLLDVQNAHKNTCFSLKKTCGKFLQFVQDGGILKDYEGLVHVFNFFVC